MTTQHRKCGCDCNDQTRWVEDTGILQATFDCGCAGGKKPPCVYWANFECEVSYRGEVFPPRDDVEYQYGWPYARGTNYRAEQLRQTCKWGPAGRYVSLRGGVPPILEVFSTATYSESCTWDDVLGFGGGGSNRLNPMQRAARGSSEQWELLEMRIQWDLMITSVPATMTHFGGARYVQKAEETWDCFGPNTLWLDKDPSEYSDYSTLPKFVCVTPDVYAVKNESLSCSQCYSLLLPSISAAGVTIPRQKLEFLRSQIEGLPRINQSVGGSGDMNSPWLFKAKVNDIYGGGRQFCELRFLDEIVYGLTSRATLTFSLDVGGSGVQDYGNYYYDQFICGEQNTFVRSSNSNVWPATLTLTPGDCTRSDQHMWGPCWRSDGPLSWEDGYPSGSTEESRKLCCDPWCSCAPGWLKVYNPSGGHLSQSFGGLTSNPSSSTAFCAGGRVGLNSPSNISREWCITTVYAADGTAHEVCMVLYCGSLGGGVTWLIDWYCDGTFVATRNMNQVLTCCPNQMSQLGPEMPCLPGAVLCVGINIEPACEPPPPPCCDLADYQSTLTLTMYTTGCSGWPATVTLTRSGSVFSGSFSVGSDAVLVTFDCVNPVNGVSCGIKFVCSSTGTSRVGQMESTTCSPPTLTGSVGLGLTFFCGCGAISSVACVLNTP